MTNHLLFIFTILIEIPCVAEYGIKLPKQEFIRET